MHNQVPRAWDTPRFALGLVERRFVATLNLNVPNVEFAAAATGVVVVVEWGQQLHKKKTKRYQNWKAIRSFTLSWQYVLFERFFFPHIFVVVGRELFKQQTK